MQFHLWLFLHVCTTQLFIQTAVAKLTLLDSLGNQLSGYKKGKT